MRTAKKAYTLIELLVVIAIVGILTSISIVGIKATRARARDAQRITDLNRVQAAIVQYYTVEKVYPDDITGHPENDYKRLDNTDPAKSLVPKYISPKLPEDPGQNQYNYNTDGKDNFALWVQMETGDKHAKEDGGRKIDLYEVGYGDNWSRQVDS